MTSSVAFVVEFPPVASAPALVTKIFKNPLALLGICRILRLRTNSSVIPGI
jgi:hypothetical protein